jgi:hypothetical protein
MSERSPNRAVIVGFVALFTVAAAPLLADVVYLKNGRSISGVRTEVNGDRLIFFQGGNRVEISMEMVDRIEEEAVELEPAPADRPPRPEPTPAPAAGASAGAEAGTEGEDVAEEDETPAEQTREYWQERVRAIGREREELQAAIMVLRREERAFLFSHRSTAATREGIEAARNRLKELDDEMVQLRRDARRQQIPPGWLRVTRTG